MIRATRKKSATTGALTSTVALSRGGATPDLKTMAPVPRRKQKRAASDPPVVGDGSCAGSDATNGVAGEKPAVVKVRNAGRPKKQRVADENRADADLRDVRGTHSNGTVGEALHGADGNGARRSKSKLGSRGARFGSELPDAAPSKSKRAAGEFDAGAAMPSARSATAKGAKGGAAVDAECLRARRPRKSSRATAQVTSNGAVPGGGSEGERSLEADNANALTCRQLQELERRYVVVERSRIMIDNRLRASVAQFMGYNAGMEEADRKSYFTTAEAVIKSITGKSACPADYLDAADLVRPLVVATGIASDGYQAELDKLEKAMVTLAKSLPVWSWAEGIRGFGAKSLARIIGESGDLSLYANPAKLWKRFGLAPFKGKMCSTWRRKGGLHADEWSEVGYNPRRRSVVWNVGECLVKLNQTGAYRKRYDEQKAKKVALASEDWKLIRCHNHGKLMAEKLLILDLWKAWRGIGESSVGSSVLSNAEHATLSV